MTVMNPSPSGALALVGIVTLSGAIFHASLGGAAHASDGSVAVSPHDGRSGRARPSEPTARDAIAHGNAGKEGRAAAAMASGSGCIEDRPLDWFGPIRELPECTVTFGSVNFPLVEGYSPDINGDGRLDFAIHRSDDLIKNGSIQPPGCVLSVSESVNVGGQVSFVERCGLRSDVFLAIVLAEGSLPASAQVAPIGWRDLDADGDLDLIVMLRTYDRQVWTDRAFWLENTGFEATQPLTGDLNSDGSVNSADLALLLGGWTGG